ncbi:MAG: PKD domain-containing protein [Bacteroidaceae bacterium]|nr:PKD domain-containing protein [Bacteroidaceae bacterium]
MNRTWHKITIVAALLMAGGLTVGAQEADVARVGDKTEKVLVGDKTIKVDRRLFPDLRLEPSGPTDNPVYRRFKARQRAGVKVQLPDHVNNGEDKYFSPIFNQDGGSCGSAQNIAYMFGHEINAWRDLDGSLPENMYPTHFTWLLTYQNSDKEVMACTNGIPNVVTYGGRTYSRLFGAQTHDDNDYGWMQGYDKWFSAMWNRAESSFSFPATNTPEGRQMLKEWLYNHCGDETFHSGGVAGIGVAAYGTWKVIPSTKNNKDIGVAGMKYVGAWGDTYNHALTIVGYDDRIEFDLDGDGKVGEADEDEVGAWIIANSWGDGWENNGFIYCPYKYCYGVGTSEVVWTPGSYYIRKVYRPLRTIKIRMDYSRRSEMLLCAGISTDLNATQPDQTINFEHFKYAGDATAAVPAPEVPMLGRWVDGMHYEPMEFGYDLTDLTATFDRTRPLKYFFIVKTKNTAVGNGHIYDASIINYEVDPNGVEIPFDSHNVAIQNKGKETVISVIVPGEQLYAPRNLQLTEGLLAWTAPQPSGLSLQGYRLYEGTTLLAELPAGKTSFRPDALGSDPYTVCAVYTCGEYLQESARSNPVVVLTPMADDNNVLILEESGMAIPSAVTQPLGQATFEFWMRSDLNRSYVDQLGPGWGTFLFHTDNSGQLYAGWNTSSGDRMVLGGAFQTGKWVHVAIVIDKNKMTAYVNGTRKGSITSTTYNGLGAFGTLKFGHSGTNQFWSAGLDEFRLWKTARTQDEIKTNMFSRIANPAEQEDLLLYLPMDTIHVGDEVRIRERVAGKHATLWATGQWRTEEYNDLISSRFDPVASIAAEESYTAGIPFTLGAVTSVDATAWTWHAEGADTPDVSGKNPSFLFRQAGIYDVTLTATFFNGETASDTTQITVADGLAPVAAFDATADVLPAGDRFSFINRTEGEGCTYVWTLPGAEVERLTTTNASALYTTLGTFSVTLTATNAYGSSSVSREVTVSAAAPAALFDVTPTAILLGDTVRLNDKSRYEPTAWTWELSNGHRCFTISGRSPAVIPVAPGIYDVTLNVSNAEGSGKTTQGGLLTVSNADARTALHFTGVEYIKLPSPVPEGTTGFTLDWWMRPSAYAGSATFTAEPFSTVCTDDGSVRVTLGSKSVTSGKGYVVLSEWHHYALVYDAGTVQFWRDGILFATPTNKLVTSSPAWDDLTVGNADNCFNGLLDEFRLWNSALSADALRSYCNAPIADVAAAEAADALRVYYDFNQSGGNVADRTSHALDATRINFGPDGDAWNSALGVFTLDLDAPPAGDITSTYLTNYQRPYYTASGTVNPTNSSRFLRLEMGTKRSAWRELNQIKNGNIVTGAHVDTAHGNDITIETIWSNFADELHDYRLWQTVSLPAGRYTFSCTLSDGTSTQTSRIVVNYGTKLVGDADCETEALAWDMLSNCSVSFTLPQEAQVSLGIIVNMTGQSCLSFSSFKLEGIPFEYLEAADETPAYTSLATLVAACTGDGNDYHSVMYNSRSTAAYFAALEAAQLAHAARTGTDDEYAALEAALREAYEGIAVRIAVPDGRYLITLRDTGNGTLKALYAFNDSLVAWNNADFYNPRFVWEAYYLDTTKKGNRYRIKNMGTGRFLTFTDADYARLTGDVTPILICPLTDYDASSGMEDSYAIRCAETGLDIAADFYADGWGVGGRTVGTTPSERTDGPAAWVFRHWSELDGEPARPVDGSQGTRPDEFTDAYPLITDAAQLSTNSPGAGRNVLSSLIDGKASTSYQTNPTAHTPEELVRLVKPYIEVSLPQPVQSFWLYTRAYNATKTQLRPMRITISASEDGDSWRPCCVIRNIANAYPQDGGFITGPEAEWYSPLLTLEQPYSRIRITVDDVNYRSHAAQDNNLFTDFGLTELQLYSPCETGIRSVDAPSADAPIYAPDGRCVGTDVRTLPAGIYISQGRKITVR